VGPGAATRASDGGAAASGARGKRGAGSCPAAARGRRTAAPPEILAHLGDEPRVRCRRDDPRDDLGQLELAAICKCHVRVTQLDRNHLVRAERERGRRLEIRRDAERVCPFDDVCCAHFVD